MSDEPDDQYWNPRREFEVCLGVPVTGGNEVTVLRNGDRIFPAMLDDVRAAQRSIDFLTFVYWTGDIAVEFAEALAERARAGASVRVLLDAIGARKMDENLIGKMLDSGCEVEWFRPIDTVEIGDVDHRTHRKVLVCDEVVGYTGGVGIAEEWTGDARSEGEWRDTHFRVRGPAVDGLRAAFLDNWAETGKQLLRPGVDRLPVQEPVGDVAVQVLPDTAETGWSTTAMAFGVMLAGARERLRITTAYFTPDEPMLERLCDARARGVSVEILVPGEHADKRFVQLAGQDDYQQVLDAGIELRTFEPSMLHAKVMTADSRVAVVGSSNLNSRSLTYDDEVLMAIFDEGIVAELDAHFDDDRERSHPLDPADWAERGLFERAKEKAVSVVSDVI